MPRRADDERMRDDASGSQARSSDGSEIVYKSCMKAYEQEVPLKQILMQTPEVTQAFTEEEVDLMLNPHSYIGLAPNSWTACRQVGNI